MFFTVRIRCAAPGDMSLIYEWANDPETRKWSLNTSPIHWEDHVMWFRRVLADPRRCLYIGEDEVPVGSVRFDLSERVAEVSITVAPHRRGQRLSHQLLEAACDVFEHRPILARVKEDNVASLRLFSDWRLDTVIDGVHMLYLDAT